MPHVAVIGAGITGVTTAYALNMRGCEVTVLERHRYAGMETSFANGGQLSASNGEVWNKASTVIQGIKWMLRRDAPLLMNPLPSWHKYSWLAEFVAHMRNYRENTIATVRLAIQARQYLFAIAEREGINFDLEQRGILHFYRDRSGFDKALKVNELLRQGGLERIPLTREEIGGIEPTLRGNYYAGFLTPSDSSGDIHKFTRGLADACAQRGVNFHYDSEVHEIVSGLPNGHEVHWMPVASEGEGSAVERSPIRVDAVVVCAGTASRNLAAKLGDRLNIYPVKGYSITVNLHTPESRYGAPSVSILDDEAKIVTSRLGRDRFRVAGTAELNGFNHDIRQDRIKPLIDWTRTHFPLVATDQVAAWSGLRPMMPNMMPRVGQGRRRGIFYNTGHGHLGWTLSAATAEIVAGTIMQRLHH